MGNLSVVGVCIIKNRGHNCHFCPKSGLNAMFCLSMEQYSKIITFLNW
jgi:hypothetical protein